MDQFLKQFTIIDFLSMFVPGGILILAWNYYIGDVTGPVSSFFGEQALILAVYFVMISYLMGMALQEISKCLEKGWEQNLESLHNKWQNVPKIVDYYQVCFGQPLVENRQKYGSGEVGRNIFLYVSDHSAAGSKLELFQAFSGMGRNSTVSAAIIFAISMLATVNQSPISINDMVVPIVSLVFVFIMYFRGRRFFC